MESNREKFHINERLIVDKNLFSILGAPILFCLTVTVRMYFVMLNHLKLITHAQILIGYFIS